VSRVNKQNKPGGPHPSLDSNCTKMKEGKGANKVGEKAIKLLVKNWRKHRRRRQEVEGDASDRPMRGKKGKEDGKKRKKELKLSSLETEVEKSCICRKTTGSVGR